MTTFCLFQSSVFEKFRFTAGEVCKTPLAVTGTWGIFQQVVAGAEPSSRRPGRKAWPRVPYPCRPASRSPGPRHIRTAHHG